MQTKQIPETEWPAFLAGFSRQHEGWLVKLEIFGPELGAQVAETGLSLEGVTGESNSIVITAGSAPDDHLTHSINCPTEVSLEQTEEGDDTALSIKSADGTTALLSFRAATFSAP